MRLPTQHFLWGYKKAHGAKPHVLFTPPSPNQPTEVWQPVASMPSWTQEPAARQQLQVPGPSLLGASHSHAPQGLPAFPDVSRGRQQGPPPPQSMGPRDLSLWSDYPSLKGNSFSTAYGIILSRRQGFQNPNPKENLELRSRRESDPIVHDP